MPDDRDSQQGSLLARRHTRNCWWDCRERQPFSCYRRPYNKPKDSREFPFARIPIVMRFEDLSRCLRRNIKFFFERIKVQAAYSKGKREYPEELARGT